VTPSADRCDATRGQARAGRRASTTRCEPTASHATPAS
jgi:hypothetical protein